MDDLASKHRRLGWSVLAALSEPVAIKDTALDYVWVNDAFCHLVGRSRDAIIGRHDDTVFPDGPWIPDPLLEADVLASGQVGERFESLATPDGRYHEYLITLTRVQDDGEWLIIVLHDVDELSAANHSLIEVSERLAAESTELRSQALVDPLSGVLNLRGFERSAPSAFAAANNGGALMMLDLDDFKQINDTHGHDVGDTTLRRVAEAIREATRRERDVIGRVGGDEFLLAIPGVPSHEALAVAERIRGLIASRRIETPTGPQSTSASIGVAWRTEGLELALDEWRRQADGALYEAKRSGKNSTVIRIVR